MVGLKLKALLLASSKVLSGFGKMLAKLEKLNTAIDDEITKETGKIVEAERTLKTLGETKEKNSIVIGNIKTFIGE